eukprot:m.128811 g.128811  ORF g.128811 m.128811 type:complete len:255 (-) comp19909_c0_seq3:88-852(-)
MRALGAKVELVEQTSADAHGQVSGADLDAVEARTQALARQLGAFRADQFTLRASFNAHYNHTGPELWQQVQSLQAEPLAAFCDFVGSGGTFAGCAAYLKEQDPSIQCFVVEPASAAVLVRAAASLPLQVCTQHVQLHRIRGPAADTKTATATATDAGDGRHRIQGGGYSKSFQQLPLLHKTYVDGYVTVPDTVAMHTAQRLAREEGVFAGFSAGANLAAALHLLQHHFAGKCVAAVACDTGLKYLSTELYSSTS